MIDAFLKYLQYEKRYSGHTLKSYENDLLQLQAHLQGIDSSLDIIHADHKMLRAWIVSMLQDKASSRTVNRKIATLRSYYKFLLSREIIEENPTLKLRSLKTSRPLPEFIQEKEMVDLLDRVPFGDDFGGTRDQLLLEMLYGTGMRLSELINIKDRDVNLYENSIKVLGKRNKERIIPLNTGVIDLIKIYLAKRGESFESKSDGHLLLTDTGEQCYPMMVYRTVRKYLGYITKTSKKSPHVLRHTYATHLLNKGADLNAVKDLLGHSSLAATQVYTHNSLEKLKSVFDQAHPKA